MCSFKNYSDNESDSDENDEEFLRNESLSSSVAANGDNLSVVNMFALEILRQKEQEKDVDVDGDVSLEKEQEQEKPEVKLEAVAKPEIEIDVVEEVVVEDYDNDDNNDNNDEDDDYGDEFDDYNDESNDQSNPTPVVLVTSTNNSSSSDDQPPSATETSASTNSSSNDNSSSYASFEDMTIDEEEKPPRLSPSELQAQLLSELALSDMLSEQLINLYEMEKTYTVASANAETAKVTSDWMTERQETTVAEQLAAQQHAYELSLHTAVEQVRKQMEETRGGGGVGVLTEKNINKQNRRVEMSKADSNNENDMENDKENDKENIENDSYSMESFEGASNFETADSSGGGGSDKSLTSFSSAHQSQGGGGQNWTLALAKQHNLAAVSSQREESKVLSIRESAVREICRRELHELKANRGKLSVEKLQVEKKRVKRNRAAALADINRERWAVKGKMYREENVFERLFPGRIGGVGGGRGGALTSGDDEADKYLGDILQHNSAATKGQDDSLSVASSGVLSAVTRNLRSEAGLITDSDSPEVVSMKAKLLSLRKRKQAAEALLSKKRSAEMRRSLPEKLEEEERLTEMIVREALEFGNTGGGGAAIAWLRAKGMRPPMTTCRRVSSRSKTTQTQTQTQTPEVKPAKECAAAASSSGSSSDLLRTVSPKMLMAVAVISRAHSTRERSRRRTTIRRGGATVKMTTTTTTTW